MNDYIIYEQPVAVNIRNFLKCEYLYEKYSYALSQEDIWSIRSSISTLIEISDFVLRINLKVELLKELEKSKVYINKGNSFLNGKGMKSSLLKGEFIIFDETRGKHVQ